jgi:hypothetical protein
MSVLADRVTWGETLHDRAVRCRQAIRSVAVEDLVRSRLLEVLCYARAQFYMYNPEALTVIKPVVTRYILTRADRKESLVTEENLQGALAQARLGDLKNKTAAHLHLGRSPPPRFCGVGSETITPDPYVVIAHETVDHVEPGEEGDSGNPPHNPFASSPAPPTSAPPSNRWGWRGTASVPEVPEVEVPTSPPATRRVRHSLLPQPARQPPMSLARSAASCKRSSM